MIYIVIGILLGILVINSLVCAFDQIYVEEVDLRYAFLILTYILTAFGLILTICWPVLYIMLRYELSKLPEEVRNVLSTKVRK